MLFLPPPQQISNPLPTKCTQDFKTRYIQHQEKKPSSGTCASLSIETRKPSSNGRKFGNSTFRAPGTAVATIPTNDNVYMTCTTSKEFLSCQEEERKPMKKLTGQAMVPCHIWKSNYWTTCCPHQDMLGSGQEELSENKKGKYVPSCLQHAASNHWKSMERADRRADNSTSHPSSTDCSILLAPFLGSGFAFISFLPLWAEWAHTIADVSHGCCLATCKGFFLPK
uniref:Eukaryotic translation initiation factor 3 subunit G N-terminal domain-containing protein n=1 Tax=Apteryx owenii TaxID=8824 RepID=A0A8B9PEU7_APTOW